MCRYLENRWKHLAFMALQPCSRPAGLMFVAFVCLLAFSNIGWSQCIFDKLTAHDGGRSDWFGYSVSISGQFVLISSPLDDDVGNNSGAVYVYRYDALSENWTLLEKLTASDAEPGEFGDLFGGAVSISGDVVVIGAIADNDACPGIPEFCNSGSAYVFRFDPNTSKWIEEDKLIASDGAIQDQFGAAVSINGDVAVVGTPFKNSAEDISGTAYVFRKDPRSNEWVEEAILSPFDSTTVDGFGRGVSVRGDVAVIVSTSNNDDLGIFAGTAFVFRYDKNTGVWNEETKLTASDADDYDWFGSVSLSDDLIVIGAAGDDDGAAINAGSAYVFKYDAKTKVWNEVDKLTASDAEQNDRFGGSVSLSNDLIIVGAQWDDDACPGDPGCNSGSAYLFQFDPKSDSWIEKAKLTASDPGEADDFGRSVSISGDFAIVGSHLDDEIATNAGAAYTYNLSACLCPADLDGDSTVNTNDLLALFAEWGKNPQSPADLNSDGTVNTTDLLILFANWGPCA